MSEYPPQRPKCLQQHLIISPELGIFSSEVSQLLGMILPIGQVSVAGILSQDWSAVLGGISLEYLEETQSETRVVAGVEVEEVEVF